MNTDAVIWLRSAADAHNADAHAADVPLAAGVALREMHRKIEDDARDRRGSPRSDGRKEISNSVQARLALLNLRVRSPPLLTLTSSLGISFTLRQSY